jgi:hypothetical protein
MPTETPSTRGKSAADLAGDLGGSADLDAGLFAGESLEGADGDGAVEADEGAVGVRPRELAAAAGGLAGRAADAAAEGGEGVGAAGDAVGVGEAAVGDGADVATGVGVDGTGDLTGDETLVVVLGGDLHVEGGGAGEAEVSLGRARRRHRGSSPPGLGGTGREEQPWCQGEAGGQRARGQRENVPSGGIFRAGRGEVDSTES